MKGDVRGGPPVGIGKTRIRPERLSYVKRLLPALAGLLLLMAASVLSLPKFATDHSEPCQSCHVNPNGGGMRNEYGNHSVALNELTLQATKKYIVSRAHSPRLTDALTFGFDTRSLVLKDLSTFRMQTDFYAAVEPIKGFTYLFRFGQAGISENYALLDFDRQKFWVMAGRFSPAFGIHEQDHTSFNRQLTGHGPGTFFDGAEAGMRLAGVNFSLGAYDNAGRGAYIAHLFRTGYIEPIGYLAGGSVQYSEFIDGSTGSVPVAKSAFGGLSYDRFTALGELDLVGRSNDTLITYGEFSTRVIFGLYAVAEYNFIDPDRHIKSGVDEYLRFSAEFYPIPFVEFRPSYTRYTRSANAGRDDYFLMIHVGY